ncbi:MAG: hypothetical protein E6J91_49265 [Deltaproteobacteria bacterium]|nr:MAG: hypothetical protein E6J91_49265 [Deltaproteobacteria bacterium]
MRSSRNHRGERESRAGQDLPARKFGCREARGQSIEREPLNPKPRSPVSDERVDELIRRDRMGHEHEDFAIAGE